MRYYILERKVSFEYILTKDMLADILTKPLRRDQFEHLRTEMQILDISIIINLKTGKNNKSNNGDFKSLEKTVKTGDCCEDFELSSPPIEATSHKFNSLKYPCSLNKKEIKSQAVKMLLNQLSASPIDIQTIVSRNHGRFHIFDK